MHLTLHLELDTDVSQYDVEMLVNGSIVEEASQRQGDKTNPFSGYAPKKMTH